MRGSLFVFAALLFKVGFKFLAFIIKLISGKISLAVISSASYSYLFTWKFALIIMVSLFVHEYGHIWAMKRCGMKTKGIYFIPFLGGAAVAEGDFPSRKAEVFIAIMGPIWGFILALFTFLVYNLTGDPIFAAAAGWMAIVNLFNLLPINPLDGGRILKSIAFSIASNMGIILLILGIILCFILTVYSGLVLLLVISIMGVIELIVEWWHRSRSFERMGKKDLVLSIVSYLLIIGALWTLYDYTSHVPGSAAAMEFLRD